MTVVWGSFGRTSTAVIDVVPSSSAFSTRLRRVTEDIEHPLHAPDSRTYAVPSSIRTSVTSPP